ncbi:hypothetical protein AVEN_13857-1 [Araneus ventricosus]|uniref:Uncharacterized protein n=1 Tax=Araneus ventricosus TaxID=182803 RepID=A0A4Y2KWM9_ARAVE|nr:hypothetical protein AVEN_13857-1 [Araneus ventricosus]
MKTGSRGHLGDRPEIGEDEKGFRTQPCSQEADNDLQIPSMVLPDISNIYMYFRKSSKSQRKSIQSFERWLGLSFGPDSTGDLPCTRA